MDSNVVISLRCPHPLMSMENIARGSTGTTKNVTEPVSSSIIPKTKQSLKIRTASAICWNSLGLFRDYDLNYIFFRNKTFLFFKIES